MRHQSHEEPHFQFEPLSSLLSLLFCWCWLFVGVCCLLLLRLLFEFLLVVVVGVIFDGGIVAPAVILLPWLQLVAIDESFC